MKVELSGNYGKDRYQCSSGSAVPNFSCLVLNSLNYYLRCERRTRKFFNIYVIKAILLSFLILEAGQP
jgi:hypothetical protein